MFLIKIFLYLIVIHNLSSTHLWAQTGHQEPQGTPRLSPHAKAELNLTLIQEAFSQAFFSNGFYTPSFCSRNVARFLNWVLERYEFLKTEDFKILYIVNKSDDNFSLTSYGVFPRYGRAHYCTSDGTYLMRGWAFHVVLEFEGFIFDFDHTIEPKAVPKWAYSHFFEDDGSQLDVAVVPGPRALNLMKGKSYLKLEDVMKKFKRQDLQNYLIESELYRL